MASSPQLTFCSFPRVAQLGDRTLSSNFRRWSLFAVLLCWSATTHAQLAWWYSGQYATQSAALSAMQGQWELPSATVLYGTVVPGPTIPNKPPTVGYLYGTPLSLGQDTYLYDGFFGQYSDSSQSTVLSDAENDITQWIHEAGSQYSSCAITSVTPGTWVSGDGPANNGYLPYTLGISGAPACNDWNPYGFRMTRSQVITCPTPGNQDLVLSATPKQGITLPDYNAGDWVCSADPPAMEIDAFVPSLECPTNNGPLPLVGEPCDVASREYYATEADYSDSTLSFARYYHSASPASVIGGGLGAGGWSHNYAAQLFISSAPTAAIRPDGHRETLSLVGGVYISSATGLHVVQSGTNWVATRTDGTSEVYGSNGQLNQIITSGGLVTTLSYGTTGLLSQVSDPFGRALLFSYDSLSRLAAVTEPDGVSTITFGYDSNSNLISATYPDSTERQYLYQNSTFTSYLTGILDESGVQVETIQYDSTTGAVVSSQEAGGALAVSITYPTTTSAVVTDSLGSTTTYQFTANSYGSPRVTSVQQNSLTQTYVVPPISTDPQQRVTQFTDAKGNITTYSYDTNHLTSKTEASGTSIARTTSYTYLSTTSALPLQVTEALRQTVYSYYPGTNNIESKTITDTSVTPNVSRTWSYSYDTYGHVLTEKGPRTDLNSTTTYSYYICTTGYQCGQLQSATDPVGNVTNYSTYNAFGQSLTMSDPNGVVTTLTYDKRQRVLSREVGNETNKFSYYSTGLLEQVTRPDSSWILYHYDSAHRLYTFRDTLGFYIYWTLDGMGNYRTEKAFDSSGNVHRTHSWVFNNLNELYESISAAGTSAVTTTFGYDNNKNQTSIAAPLSRNSAQSFDALNRAYQATDPASGLTEMTYDADDSITSVVDPRGLTTTYNNSGFDQSTQISSPDTGNTQYSYDSAGNVSTVLDARGATTTYSYDAANRVTSAAYTLGSTTDLTEQYTYDSGGYGKGHLTGASDQNHTMTWAYDAQGRVVSKSQSVASVARTVSYTYTNADLTKIVTPSGQTVTYGYNANHQVTSLAINGTTVLSSATYEPLGPVNGWTWGDGTTEIRSYNTDGNLSAVDAVEAHSYAYDNALRVTGITNSSNSALSWTYGYDALDRSTSATSTGTTLGWTYDSNGNRLTATGSVSGTYTNEPTSNQLSTVTGSFGRTYAYDAAGNTLSYTGSVFTYYNNGRLQTATVGGTTTTYVFNALGQRIEKSGGPAGTVITVYDESGHLLGEYGSGGTLIQETAWLGDIPVATIRPNGSSTTVFYVHADHLNAPRMVTQVTTETIVWRWDTDPFGTAAANQDPAGFGTFIYNLRYPGQYFDAETGLNYNYLRDAYDSQTGRYLQGDPIGLDGGSMSPYIYADGNPISNIDPLGLWDWPEIPDPLYNYTVGLADDLSFGIGPIARRALGINGGINRCSMAYKAGQYTGLVVGAGRLAYAGAVKAVSLAPGVSGAAAAAFRNGAKQFFRGPLGGLDYKMYTYEQLLEKYGTDEAVRAAAGRTNPLLNAIGANATIGGAVSSASSCSCQ